MRLPLAISLAVALTLLAWPGSVAQSEAPVVLVVEGNELDACDPTAAQLICFNVVTGDPDAAFHAGETVRVELTAAGEAPHSIHVIMEDEASPVNAGTGVAFGTPIAMSPQAESGATVHLEFTVPETGVLYFYCGVPDHEPVGMHFTGEIQPPLPAEPEPENETGNETGNGNETGGNNTGDGNATAPPEPTVTPTDDTTNNDATDGNGTDNGSSPEDEEAPFAPLALLITGLVAVAAVARRHRRQA